MNPIATQDQKDTEMLALRMIEAPAVRSAREVARRELLGDPVFRYESAKSGLERALDQWTLALAMRKMRHTDAKLTMVDYTDDEGLGMEAATLPEVPAAPAATPAPAIG